MADEQRSTSFQRLSSDSTVSTGSDDSYEYYQTDIYEQLPSTLTKRRWQQVEQTYEVGSCEYDLLPPSIDRDPHQPLNMLPLCMQEKRNLRDRRHQERLRIGFWASWRQSQQIARRRLREQVGRFFSGLLPWKHTLHKIEGRFGVGVKAYFVFLRYLICLNLLNCAIITGFVLVPSLYHKSWEDYKSDNKSILHIFLGSGFLEGSPLFYGFYQKIPLFFHTGMGTILFLSLIMIVRRMVVGYKHMWLMGKHFSLNVSYKVFYGWDFCIQDPQAASLEHSFIRNELKMDLEEQRFRQKVSERSMKQWACLYFLRGILNFVVVVLLCGSFTLIYYAIISAEKKESFHWTVKLLMNYLPPITITVVNFLLPHVFSRISMFEDYFLTTQLNLTLVRSIFLKLGTLAIYIIFITIQNNTCAENEFGKEMYKLTIFQLLACFCNTFLIVYLKRLLAEKYPSSKLARMIGIQEFVIPLNVLDLVYSQTVTWVGVFYCPLLPGISTIKLLAIFYMKKFTVMRCCVPAQRLFRTSSSAVLFHFMLLLGLIMSFVTIGVNSIRSDAGCGPLGNDTMYSVMDKFVKTLPISAQTTISYITSEAFIFALILAEIIILTSFVSHGRANRKTIERLKDMLVMCSSDKRYLVKQHSTWLRQRYRSSETEALGK
ncbi:transmembrane channel-like protein 7 isoform X2 [Electrophorus electricus]|uniref:Transmembrane channel-like protein n=1 Tax=Electrophorus electricus TaxID=8005 RepID=A0A4W4HCF2_ELEEL|nr:transmembrane channel-like protein 7 isoform X2 [Electrophorus electricus]